jgi:beta-galactosidase
MTLPPRPATAPSALLFGAAYYPEYQPRLDLENDFRLMAEANFTVIRVGESVWSTWEPRDGEFDLEWLAPTLDAAQRHGISVILGTPTYAVPPWLQKKHPDIALQYETGRRRGWGGRQEVDFSHPEFRPYAERVIRAVVGRYADHPAVIGFQVDNEPGLELIHNEGSFARFLERLEAQYGDVETLNREWGLVYWSHRLQSFDELWTPDGNWQPQYDLAWRRHQAALTTEFIAWQADIVREYARPEQFVTTCIAYPRPALDDEKLTLALDVTAANPYYGMQDRLDATKDIPPFQPWTSTGVWGLLRQADRAYSSKQARYLVTETNAQAIAGPSHNHPPYPGQLVQAGLAFVARGAAMIEYWHWHTLHFGTETYWGGVLPHSQRPGRVYREVAELGRRLKGLGTRLEGYEPDADVAVLWSTDTRFAFEFAPPLTTADSEPDKQSYRRIFDAAYRGVVDAGAQARVLHVAQAEQLGATELAGRFPVLLAPAVYAATDAQLQLLADYAEAGGHLIVGVRTGYGDDEGRARFAVAPDLLHASAGVWYEEFSNLDAPLELEAASGFALSADAHATAWADGLIADGAEVLAAYRHPELGRFPAITTRASGAGRVTVVGTVPDPALAADVVRYAVAEPIAAGWGADGTPVRVTSGRTPAGDRIWFVHNWSGSPADVTIPEALTDLDTGDALVAGSVLSLPAWSVLTAGREGA